MTRHRPPTLDLAVALGAIAAALLLRATPPTHAASSRPARPAPPCGSAVRGRLDSDVVSRPDSIGRLAHGCVGSTADATR